MDGGKSLHMLHYIRRHVGLESSKNKKRRTKKILGKHG